MDWIKESANRAKQQRDHYTLKDIEIFIKDKLPPEIDADFVFKYVAARIPDHLLHGIDIIYVGQFKHLIDKEVNALYQDGAIYITNKQDNDLDFIDDLIHEVAHSNEKAYAYIIYEDDRVESEFKYKRAALYRTLKDLDAYHVPLNLVSEINYDRRIDDFLYKEVTYPVLRQLTTNLFTSPYAATSVREYFSKGFEEFYLGNKERLREICPALYNKLIILDSTEE
jgi:hypothetical protein